MGLIAGKQVDLFDLYWMFAHERMEMVYGKLSADDVLSKVRFTAPYRAVDRTSQYLIGQILYPDGTPNPSHDDPNQVIRDVLLYKLFNRVDTWEHWVNENLSAKWEDFSWQEYLGEASNIRPPLFNAAYITPMWQYPPGYETAFPAKTARALQTVEYCIMSDLGWDLLECNAAKAYDILSRIPNFGPFLSYQLLTDLGYTELYNWGENHFVKAGPQAREGVAQVFGVGVNPEEVIREFQTIQKEEFDRLELPFRYLFGGRTLSLIDIQNLFCEFTKYIKLGKFVHENLVYNKESQSKRYRLYTPSVRGPLKFWFPNKWGINPDIPEEFRLWKA